MSKDRIQKSAGHMLEYRKQKLQQEALFRSLQCPAYLPNIFTLIGPITYANQAAAWAQILKARVLQAQGALIDEPDAKKAWVNAGSKNHDKGTVWISHLQLIDGILETVEETVLARW